jgi:hypothetical protein
VDEQVKLDDVGPGRAHGADLASFILADVAEFGQAASQGGHVDAKCAGAPDGRGAQVISVFPQPGPHLAQSRCRQQDSPRKAIKARFPGGFVLLFGDPPVDCVLVGEQVMAELVHHGQPAPPDVEVAVDDGDATPGQQDRRSVRSVRPKVEGEYQQPCAASAAGDVQERLGVVETEKCPRLHRSTFRLLGCARSAHLRWCDEVPPIIVPHGELDVAGNSLDHPVDRRAGGTGFT